MSKPHKMLLLGQPGTGKSLAALSYPGVEQHVFGSSEDDTARNFPDRKDILTPVKFSWQDEFTQKDLDRLAKIDASDKDILDKQREKFPIYNQVRARPIGKYIDYLMQLSFDVKAGKRPELKAVVLDNLTPFSEDVWAYTQWQHARDYTEKTMWNLNGDFQGYIKMVLEILDKLPIHTIVTCHVAMELEEETKAKTNFLEQARVASQKEWFPSFMGKFKYQLAGRFSYAMLLYTEESPGQDVKYFGKMICDSKNDGVSKNRFNPFKNNAEHGNGRRIKMPDGTFYQFLEDALGKQAEDKK